MRSAHVVHGIHGPAGSPPARRGTPRAERLPWAVNHPLPDPRRFGGPLARLARGLEAHRRLLAASNVLAAALFVLGCIAFYWPMLAAGGVTLFLLGSLLFLVSALGSALLDHRR